MITIVTVMKLVTLALVMSAQFSPSVSCSAGSQSNFSGSYFICPQLSKSGYPTSVHKLKPSDIRVIGAMGDSLTTGLGAFTGPGNSSLSEYRGFSWSGGGESDLSCVTTLPNILRQYNPDLRGYATGNNTDGLTEHIAQLNVATNGAFTADMLEQARELVQRARRLDNVDFLNDWKIVTIYVGINDVCSLSCQDNQVNAYVLWVANIEKALDYLRDNLPRTFVNLVQIMDAGELMKDVKNYGEKCSQFPCKCKAFGNVDKMNMFAQVINNYQMYLNLYNSTDRYNDLDNFTVVLQPFLSTVVLSGVDGDADHSLFLPYCNYPSPAGHRQLALGLWNNMFEQLGNKSREFHLPVTDMTCPTDKTPYLFTAKNSKAPSPPVNVRARATSSTSIHVRWSRPIMTNGYVLITYIITFYPTDVGMSAHVNLFITSRTNADLIELKKSTTYTIFVRAMTVSVSKRSNSVMEKTLEEGVTAPEIIENEAASKENLITTFTPNSVTEEVDIMSILPTSLPLPTPNPSITPRPPLKPRPYPTPPANVTAAATSSSSIHLSWSGTATKSYFITYYPTNVGLADAISTLVQDATTIELTNLRKFTSYTIVIRTFTFTLSEPSNGVKERTFEDAPSAPAITSVTNIRLGTVEVEWMPPLMPNGNLQNYTVTYYETGSNNANYIRTPELQVNISGLQLSTNYSITVAGRTIVDGEESEVVTIVTINFEQLKSNTKSAAFGSGCCHASNCPLVLLVTLLLHTSLAEELLLPWH